MTVQALLEEVRRKVSHVRQSSEDMRDRFLAIEAELHKIQPGVGVWLEDPVAIIRDSGWFIGYMRVRGDSRLAARQGDERPIALVKAPRYVRVAASERIEDLLQLMVDRLDEQRETTRRASRRLS